MVKKFTKKDIRKYAEIILGFMRTEGIISKKSFEDRIGTYSMNNREKIRIEMRLSDTVATRNDVRKFF